ncbi:MAG TPA: transposase [Bdellovibrionota bacterium]|jgi:REP element-mobilizing transposase RayT
MRYHRASPPNLEAYRRDKGCFGGDLLRGNPKGRRPFSHHSALHLVVRSTLAKGPRSMLLPRHRKQILAIVRKQARTFEVKVYRYANSGNHLHFLVRPPRTRAQFVGFTKAITGLIARTVTQARRGKKVGLRFWDKRPFSRIIRWGRAFQCCARYVTRNTLEAMGFEEADFIDYELKSWRSKGS